jgi:TrmH family RNA methyltransferase
MSNDIDIRFVLARPRTPGNVGSVARAMKNFGFSDLVLVDPRLHSAADTEGEEPAFERESRQMAWGAADVLDRARRVPTLAAAVADCGLVLGTAPQRANRVQALRPEEAADLLLAQPHPRPAVIFGSESSGLTSEEAARLAGVVVIPTDAGYRDLNLAMSATILAYVIRQREGGANPFKPLDRATHAEVEAVADGMIDLGLRGEFLQGPGIPVARELRAMLHRVGLTPREAGLLRSLWRRIRHQMSNDRPRGSPVE